jgi:hypothetical protein
MKFNNSHIGSLIVAAFFLFTLYSIYIDSGTKIYLVNAAFQAGIYLSACYFIGTHLPVKYGSKVYVGIAIGIMVMLLIMFIGTFIWMEVIHYLNTN